MVWAISQKLTKISSQAKCQKLVFLYSSNQCVKVRILKSAKKAQIGLLEELNIELKSGFGGVCNYNFSNFKLTF